MNQISFSRRQTLALLGAGTATAALGGCQRALSTPPEIDAAAYLDRLAWQMIALSPESATSLGIDKGEHAGLRGRLSDRSSAGQAKVAALLREGLAQIDRIAPVPLDPATRTSLAVVKSAFSVSLDGFALPYGDVAVGGWRNTPYVVIQNVGAYLDVPRFLDSDHPVNDAADAEAYLSRLEQFPIQLDGELERLGAAGRIGAIAPSFLLDKAIRQMELSLKDAQGGGGLVESLARRTAKIPGEWAVRARTLATGRVAAALARQLAELKAQRAKASVSAGMWARPKGDEWYAWALRASTTTRRSPDEVHALGLEALKELHGRMDPILRGLGYTNGTVGERMTALGKDPRFQFSNDDKGRAEIIALMQAKVDYMRAQAPRAFRNPVRGNLEIRRLPPAEESGAPGAYGGAGSIDGTVPGKIWLNLSTTELHSRYSIPTLAFHEGIFGHVWQGEYANRLPLIRTLLAFNAYSEGWALYAETLGDELGVYDGDPVGQLGYLQSIAFRACRLVVDTGLHAKRWTREQAIDWFATTNGSGRAEVSSEVDRYCSWPGQACGYKMGHSEILALRNKARGALGGKYDLRDFNDAVVGGGNVPLDVLGQNVDRYITSTKG
ncbi:MULTISPECIES: DUF885 family protein [unclassified Novosphingobium]|uniref:DUF885 domain-containing protein n=1 Tax=unclassified Novosphingobium TaxID=2644732 RepID=UPI000EB9CC1E|nr:MULTISPECIES: DUF885 family protein [unclassified Novosphingobium]HCF25581.1 DUF885 domain-containing protein [Novosphingobium sp.]HQV04065.1 DUF885 family protein [Novosphingobium sp.]